MTRSANHLPHLLLLLHAVEEQRRTPAPARLATPSSVFIARDEGETFWELVGLRVAGHPSVLLGALRFRRQEGGAEPFARQSLVGYLSVPLREVALDRTPRPPHLVELMVPDRDETVHQFLARTGREAGSTVLVDRREIELAFDFRLANPSRSRPLDGAGEPDEPHLFRTVAGHVLSAQLDQLPAKLHRTEDFVALTRPTQHTATLDRPLPTLVMHRRFLSMTARAGGGVGRWLEHSAPFHAALANPVHLLDPMLESYRAQRERLHREELTAPPPLPAAERPATGSNVALLRRLG